MFLHGNRKFTLAIIVFSLLSGIGNALNLDAKQPAELRRGKWRLEKRAGIVEFRVPKKLKLKYTNRNVPANKYPGMGEMDFFEFQDDKIRIAFVINRRTKFKDLFKAQCGNDSFAASLVRSYKISKPKPGFFQERKFSGQHSMQLFMDGGRDSYFFLVSWPLQQEAQAQSSVSRDEFKQIVDSLRFISARKDAGE